MPWAVAAAAIGVAGTVYASDNAANSQQAALDAQTGQAKTQAQIAQGQLDFNKQVYADGSSARTDAQKNSNDIAAAQLRGMQFATDQAKSDKAYNEGTFRPLETGLVTDAQGYDTTQRRETAAQAAQADVDQSFNATNAATERDIARDGIAPGSGKAMSLMQDAAISQAAARAGAGTMAGRNVEQQGYARRMDAATLGRNLPSNQATQQQIAGSTGSASSLAGMNALTAQQSGVGNMNAGYAGATAANNSAGLIYGSAAGGFGQVNAAQTTGIGALGNAVGSLKGNTAVQNWMSSFGSTPSASPGTFDFGSGSTPSASFGTGSYDFSSDENVKTNTDKKANPDQALAQINATPVQDGWQYDPAKGGPDDGGMPHTGPMAQQVRKHMGNAVAPGGKRIDIVSMNGKMLAGMQALTTRVKQLENRRS